MANPGKVLRVDQGVDFDSPSVVRAFASGTVTRVSPRGSWAGGTGAAVYITLDKPIKINGRVYTQIYYAERDPLVRLGQHVRVGDAVMQAGSNEIGFANSNKPVAPLVGGLGAGTKPTTAGQDFLDFVKGVKMTAPPKTAPPTGQQPSGGPPPPSITDIAANDTTGMMPSAPPPASSTLPTVLPPGSGGLEDDPAKLWQMVSMQPSVTPETQSWAQNAMLGS